MSQVLQIALLKPFVGIIAIDCSKTVVVPCSKWVIFSQIGANSKSGNLLRSIVEQKIFLTVQNPLWNSKSAGA
jgi:hypothetical protein